MDVLRPPGAGFHAASDGSLGIAFSLGGQLQLWTSGDRGLSWVLEAGAGAVGDPDHAGSLCIGKVGGEWRQGIDTRLPAGGSDWLQAAWPWSSKSQGDGSLCASDGTTYWVLGVDESFIPVMTISDTHEGEPTPAYPVWYPDMPTTGTSQHYFSSMAAAGGRLYGMSAYSAETDTFELWSLR